MRLCCHSVSLCSLCCYGDVTSSQSVEESRALMAQALKEVYTLLMTLLAKEFSSENLESIFKVREEGREKREGERGKEGREKREGEREREREGGEREKIKGRNTVYYSIPQSHTQHLEPWIQSSDELERTRAMTYLLGLLKMYLAHSEENEVVQN